MGMDVSNQETQKILIFSNAYYPKHVGGAEVAIREITDRIPTDRYEFHMVTNRFDSSLPKTEQLGNVTVHRLGFSVRGADTAQTHHPLFYIQKILFVPQAAFRAWRLHRTYRYDCFWSMMAYMTFPVTLLRLFGVRVPYVLTLQEGDPFAHVFERWHIRMCAPLLRAGFRNAATVQTISTFLADWVKQMDVQTPVVVIPNGVDFKHFSTCQSDAVAAVKSNIGKQSGETWLIHTGRYVHKNALDTVIRALAELPEHVHLLLLGDGPDRETLRSLTASYGLSRRVHFHEHVDNAKLPSYLHASDIFIRPSRSEGMGISFIEAMAASLPVVATQIGGISDFLFDSARNPEKEPTGFAVETDDPQHIAEVVTDVMTHPERVAAVVKNARTMVKETYDWGTVTKHMQEQVFRRW